MRQGVDRMEERSDVSIPEEPSLIDEFGEATFKALIGAVPIFGPMIAEYTGVALKAGANRKNYLLLASMAKEIELLKRRDGLSVDEIFANTEFQSYLTRAVMIAWETHEEEKIRAVARAALRSGPWEGTGVSEKEYYWSLLRRYSADYLVALRIFHQPRLLWDEWELKTERVPFDHLFQNMIGFPAHHDEIGQAIMYAFYQDKLTSAAYGLGNTFERGETQSRLTTLGGDFVKFYEEYGSEPTTDK